MWPSDSHDLRPRPPPCAGALLCCELTDSVADHPALLNGELEESAISARGSTSGCAHGRWPWSTWVGSP
jgi:hypothetical protein